MIETRLTYRLIHEWYSENLVSCIGSAFHEENLLKEKSLHQYFKETKDEKSFVECLQKISGHFSVIIETETAYFIGVDVIRTFPLFIKKEKENILVSDNIITCEGELDETESANFCKIYCTLENNTLLKDWKQLQAGEYAVIYKQENTINIKTYFTHSGISGKLSEQDIQHKISEAEIRIIDRAVAYAANRTILIPLSGGFDSRYLLALLKERAYQRIECYTYGKKDSPEVMTAKEVCEKLGIKWHFIEYTDELLQSFFSEKWNSYSSMNHHFSSLPHEQDFFALYYLQQQKLLPENAVIMNGFCQDIHAGSFLEPENDFNLTKYIHKKYQIKPDLSAYKNSWDGYQEWLVKNRLSKFIVNSVRVCEYFNLDFYLPFWDTEWIKIWYELPYEYRLYQRFYHNYLNNGIFKKYHINSGKPSNESISVTYNLKKIVKKILPERFIQSVRRQKNRDRSKDFNNTLFLYENIYTKLNNKPEVKNFEINNIHALYLLQKLKEKHQL